MHPTPGFKILCSFHSTADAVRSTVFFVVGLGSSTLTDTRPSRPLLLSLPRHRDANSVLRLDQVICAFRGVGDGELHTFHRAVEGVAQRAVVRGNRGAAVLTNIAAVVGGENHCQGRVDVAFADLLAVDVERSLAAFSQAAPGLGELHAYLIIPRGNALGGLHHALLETAPVIA